jgi:hypothetical protein
MPNRKNSGIYTAEMGQPPKDIDMGSAGMGKSRPKIASGSKVGMSPATRAVDAMRGDDSTRHYKGVSNAMKQK